MHAALEYAYSIHARGDNTVANAKAAGGLDVHELYPDLRQTTLEEFAEGFYTEVRKQ
jgi:hypothetical protein